MAVCLSSGSDRMPDRSLNFNLDSLSYFSIVYETAILLICGGLSLHIGPVNYASLFNADSNGRFARQHPSSLPYACIQHSSAAYNRGTEDG